jgi:hypothetical protein
MMNQVHQLFIANAFKQFYSLFLDVFNTLRVLVCVCVCIFLLDIVCRLSSVCIVHRRAFFSFISFGYSTRFLYY